MPPKGTTTDPGPEDERELLDAIVHGGMPIQTRPAGLTKQITHVDCPHCGNLLAVTSQVEVVGLRDVKFGPR